MSIQDELLEVERGFWTGGADYYRQNLDDVCVTVFTEMAGAFKRDEIAGMITETDRWRQFRRDPKGFLEPSPGFCHLAYMVNATRKNNDPYAGRRHQRLCQAQRRVEDGVASADPLPAK